MNNYSNIQKFLHDVLLSKKFLNKSLFELEKIFYLKNKNIKNEFHIFISGMPRSGTTILLNFLYSSNDYASLTYQNMPFILSPNFSKLFNKNSISSKERLHADGININSKSPEALDEIFFNNDEDFVRNELENYIQLILMTENKKKYLSKNNLNYKRLDLIRSLLPKSIFLIPIREPLQHAYSLLTQHNNFKKLQLKDNFIRRYMNYLGHNEFGLDHKPWNKPILFKDENNINYWLEQWCLFYKFLYDKFKSYENTYFIIYEELQNEIYIKELINLVKQNKNMNLKLDYFKNSNKKINIAYDKDNYNQAKLVYENFYNLKLFKQK